jgi:hypothetical protein
MNKILKTFFRSALVALVVSSCGGQAESIEGRCKRVRDRLIALEIRDDDPKAESHAVVMRRAMGPQFVSSCMRAVSDREQDCVFEATEAKTAFACIADSMRSTRQARRNRQ